MELRVSPIIPLTARGNNCSLCNGAQRTLANGEPERMIDTGVHIEYEGFIAICETCVTHMARALGMFTPADVERLTLEVKELLEQNVGYAQRVQELEATIEAQNTLLRVALAPEPEVAEPEVAA